MTLVYGIDGEDELETSSSRAMNADGLPYELAIGDVLLAGTQPPLFIVNGDLLAKAQRRLDNHIDSTYYRGQQNDPDLAYKVLQNTPDNHDEIVAEIKRTVELSPGAIEGRLTDYERVFPLIDFRVIIARASHERIVGSTNGAGVEIRKDFTDPAWAVDQFYSNLASITQRLEAGNYYGDVREELRIFETIVCELPAVRRNAYTSNEVFIGAKTVSEKVIEYLLGTLNSNPRSNDALIGREEIVDSMDVKRGGIPFARTNLIKILEELKLLDQNEIECAKNTFFGMNAQIDTKTFRLYEIQVQTSATAVAAG
jgi:hypothetical protein